MTERDTTPAFSLAYSAPSSVSLSDFERQIALPTPDILHDLARNAETPQSVLGDMWRSRTLRRFLSEIAPQIAVSKNLPSEVFDSMKSAPGFEALVPMLATRLDAPENSFEEFVAHPSPDVRRAAAANPGCPFYCRQILFNDRSESVRRALLFNPNTTEEERGVLSSGLQRSDSEPIRALLADYSHKEGAASQSWKMFLGKEYACGKIKTTILHYSTELSFQEMHEKGYDKPAKDERQMTWDDFDIVIVDDGENGVDSIANYAGSRGKAVVHVDRHGRADSSHIHAVDSRMSHADYTSSHASVMLTADIIKAMKRLKKHGTLSPKLTRILADLEAPEQAENYSKN